MKDILNKLRADFEYLTGEDYTGLVRAIGMLSLVPTGITAPLDPVNTTEPFAIETAFGGTSWPLCKYK
jgi:hypothetical protein